MQKHWRCSRLQPSNHMCRLSMQSQQYHHSHRLLLLLLDKQHTNHMATILVESSGYNLCEALSTVSNLPSQNVNVIMSTSMRPSLVAVIVFIAGVLTGPIFWCCAQQHTTVQPLFNIALTFTLNHAMFCRSMPRFVHIRVSLAH